jgi:hypothetical protein
VIFVGPGAFVEMLFPLAGFVQVILKAPVNWKIVDPPGAVSALPNTLPTSCVMLILKPQLSVKRGPKSTNCHPSPRPRRRAPGWPSPRLRSCSAARRAQRLPQLAPWRSPPPSHRTVARCRAYRPAAGHAAVTIADLPDVPLVEGNVNTYSCGRHLSATAGNGTPSSWSCSVLPVVALRRFAARQSGLAFGLALAVRPAGSAEVSGAQGRVPLTLEGPTRTMRGVPARRL